MFVIIVDAKQKMPKADVISSFNSLDIFLALKILIIGK